MPLSVKYIFFKTYQSIRFRTIKVFTTLFKCSVNNKKRIPQLLLCLKKISTEKKHFDDCLMPKYLRFKKSHL